MKGAQLDSEYVLAYHGAEGRPRRNAYKYDVRTTIDGFPPSSASTRLTADSDLVYMGQV
jgi:hypothetical protein